MKLKKVKVGKYYVVNKPGHTAHGKSCKVIDIDIKGIIEISVGHFNQINYRVSSGELC